MIWLLCVLAPLVALLLAALAAILAESVSDREPVLAAFALVMMALTVFGYWTAWQAIL